MRARARIASRQAQRTAERLIQPLPPAVELVPQPTGASTPPDHSLATLSVLPEVTPAAAKIQREANDNRTPAPAPTPAPPPNSPGDGAEQLKTGNAGSTTILAPTITFRIYSGKTLKDVAAALPEESGELTFDIGTATDGDPITRATVTVRQAMVLPRWAERDAQCKPIQVAWDRFASALRQHEDEHVRINKEQLGSAHERYAGRATNETQDVTTELENDTRAAGYAFDARTDHGRTGTPSTTIDVGAKCDDKTTSDAGFDQDQIQAKLEVSEPGDPDEEEADRVAEMVMRMAEPRERPPLRLVSGASVQRCAACEAEEEKWKATPEAQSAGRVHRKCAECTAKENALEEEERKDNNQRVLRKETTGRSSVSASSRVVGVTKSGGQPLDDDTRAFMEPRFGFDFSRVRIHADAQAAEAAQSVSARAYTLGRNVVFNAGRYSPRTDEGQRLLAHELAHVVQQTTTGRVVQRAPATTDENPVQKALRTRDPADAKAIKSFTGASLDDRFELIRVLAYQGWVGPLDEYKIEEIWRTVHKSDLPAIASREIVLWNHCINVGAELDKLPAVREIRGSFIQDIRTLAKDYLWKNKKFVEEQMASAGLPRVEGQLMPPPTEDQARKMDAMRQAAAAIANNQAEQERAKRIDVGYDPKQVRGGLGELYDKYYPAKFNPHRRPQLQSNPTSLSQVTLIVNITPYDQVKAAYDRSIKATQDVLTAHPMLYAISREGKSDVTGGFAKNTDPAAARAVLAGAMRKLLADIQKTEDLVTSSATFPLDLIPLQEQLFGGKKPSHPEVEDWSLTFTRQIGKEVKGEHDFGNALDAMGLQVVSAAAFLLAPLTSGASLAALLAVGVGAAGVKAYSSTEQYDNLLQASKTAAVPGTGLVADAQVDEAKATMEADQAALALAVVTAAALGIAGVARWIAGRRSGDDKPGDRGTDGGESSGSDSSRLAQRGARLEQPPAKGPAVAVGEYWAEGSEAPVALRYKSGEKGQRPPRSDLTSPQRHVLGEPEPGPDQHKGVPKNLTPAEREAWLQSQKSQGHHPGPRSHDAEAKLFEDVLSRTKPTDKGEVHFKVNYPPCPACQDVIHRFRAMRPGIQVVQHSAAPAPMASGDLGP